MDIRKYDYDQQSYGGISAALGTFTASHWLPAQVVRSKEQIGKGFPRNFGHLPFFVFLLPLYLLVDFTATLSVCHRICRIQAAGVVYHGRVFE